MNRLARTLDQCRYRLSLLPERLARLRYFRGHGVHSPFVYAIVRQVFMRSTLNTDAPLAEALYRSLREHRVPHKQAVLLANLCLHCGYGQISFGPTAAGPCLMALRDTAPTALAAYARAARDGGGMLIIQSPCLNREREQACCALVAAHDGTSVDHGGCLLLFNNEKLPKQHYRI